MEKVFIMIDNARLNDYLVKEVSKWLNNWETNMLDDKHLPVRCMTHVVNLIEQDGFKKGEWFYQAKKFNECY